MRGIGRFIVYSIRDEPLFDLTDDVVSAERREKLNGEHSLTIVTSQRLEVGMRILRRDGTGKWREYVVDEADETHDSNDALYGTYGATWSIQHDLDGIAGGVLWASAEDGTHEPIAAASALAIAISGQSRWQVGHVTLTSTAGASLYDGQIWDYLSKLVEVWGGEIEPRIEVSSTGVIGRYVDWLTHIGSTKVTRRFDFGEDCTSIRRKASPGPYYCGVEPRGGSTGTDNDGVDYSDRCGIEEEPDCEGHALGSPYLYDLDVKEAFKRPDGNGGWEYPCKVVTYSLKTKGDQEELLNYAVADLRKHTRPKVSYEADVLQFAAAGMDVHGVQLGDEVHIVDRTFGIGPLRLQARVTEMVVNELDESDVKLTIGEFDNLREAINGLVSSAVGTMTDDVVERIKGSGTIVYLQHLIDSINTELNATNGYCYFVQGEGFYTYDHAVTNPSVGTEASKVVQIVSGGIRIANSRTQAGDWDWKTVFVSGHILAELITAANITAGYIGNVNSGSYWNLDTGEFHLASGATIGSSTVQTVIGDLSTAKDNATQALSDASQALSDASQALSDASDAAKTATNYLDYSSSTGLSIKGNSSSSVVNIDGNSINFKTGVNGNTVLKITANQSDPSIRLGYIASTRVEVNSAGLYVYCNHTPTGSSSSRVLQVAAIGRAHAYFYNPTIGNYVDLGYGDVSFSLGTRNNALLSGYFSFISGCECDASGAYSRGSGYQSKADANCAIAEGYQCEAIRDYGVAIGNSCKVQGTNGVAFGLACKSVEKSSGGSSGVAIGRSCNVTGVGFAFGIGLSANGQVHELGQWNSGGNGTGSYGDYFLIGNGTDSSSRSNGLTLSKAGNLWIAGTLTQNSDRRLKEHHSYLGDDACEFIRRLKPALFTKDNERHLGFYAQDVQDAEPDEWNTATVTSKHSNDALDFDPLTLEYTALIAPLTTYAQSLEKRVEALEAVVSRQQEQIGQLLSLIGGGER